MIKIDKSRKRHCLICGIDYKERRGIDCFYYYNISRRHKWSKVKEPK